jgi:hypothetical protein
VSVWPDTGPTPLILPGNPAFSADLARRKPTSVWVLGGVVAGIAVALGSLFYASLDEDRDEPSAMAVLVEPQTADPAPTPVAVDTAPIATATDQPLPDTLRLPPIPDAAAMAAELSSAVAPAARTIPAPVTPVPAPRVRAVPPTVTTPSRTPVPVAAVAMDGTWFSPDNVTVFNVLMSSICAGAGSSFFLQLVKINAPAIITRLNE